jgi:hypothetical protein
VPEVLFGAGTRAFYARRGERQLVLPFPERAGAPGVGPLLLPVASDRCLPQHDDLAAAEPAVLQALRAALEARLGQDDAGTEPPLDEATRARLQQLGYLR